MTHSEDTTLGNALLMRGNCIQRLAELPDNSVDAIVTDPPYGLEFMGKEWDSFSEGGGIGWKAGQMADTQALPDGNTFKEKGFGKLPVFRGMSDQQRLNFYQFTLEWASQCYRVLKDGGHLLAFGGSRMYHRLACGIEDAGFEIRDQMMWIYGSGFPKSQNVGKALEKAGFADEAPNWDGWGTALKPAHEPIVLARKPISGSIYANVLRHGTGALNIDDCRISTNDRFGGGPKGSSGFVDGYNADGWTAGSELGRWPANVLHDGSEEATAPFPNAKGGAYPAVRGQAIATNFASNQPTEGGMRKMGDDGSAARFFAELSFSEEDTASFIYCPKAPTKERNAGLAETRNPHPTVKPLALMRYLVRLITPPNGLVVDPFAGSGTTLVAATQEGMRSIGVEQDSEYWPLIEARVRWATEQPTDKPKPADSPEIGLFD